MKPAYINQKIAIAHDLYDKWAGTLEENSAIAAQIRELSARLEDSNSFSLRSGVSQACMLCDRDEGGSCCGAGIEDRYTPELLLINLLLGATLPESRHWANSCHFLGERGCILPARDILCVNYLCSKLKKSIPPENLLQLQQVNGSQMELLFLLHDRIRNFVSQERVNREP
ncbi:MAG TPA: hypothetical protein VEF34_17515 [Syntrophobacteraceae bacterium]|nr:hypothetical protein [Syntrophobacteraceae bacterium]